MAKRKSRAIDEREENQSKKRKKHDSLSTTTLAPQPSSLPSIDHLEPPPGLSKGQRKRWRRQQRKILRSATEASTRSPAQASGRSSHITGPSQDRSQITTERDATVHRTLVERYGTTRLLSIPQKQWYDERQSLGILFAPLALKSSRDAKGLPGSSEGTWHSSEQTGYSERPKQRPGSPSYPQEGVRRDSRSTVNKSNIDATFTASDRANETAISQHSQRSTAHRLHKETSIPSLSIERSPPTNTHTSTTSRLEPPTLMSSSRALRTNWPIGNPRERKTSFGQKPSSIPAHTVEADVAASFKRFTAFLRGKDAESDEDSNEESESQSDSSDASLTRLPGDAKRASEQVEGRTSVATEHPATSKSSQDSKEPMDQPNPAKSANAPFTISSNSWRANMGIKRHTSSPRKGQRQSTKPADRLRWRTQASAEPDATICKSVLGFSSNPSDDENSQDLFRTIDEISRDVFSITRPLPACKSPVSPDLKREGDQEHGLMTPASRDRRVTRSMSTPKGLEKGGIVVIPVPKEIVVACHSVHVPNVELPLILRPQQVKEKANDETSESRAGELGQQAAQDGDSRALRSKVKHTPSMPAESNDASQIPAGMEHNDGSKDEASEVSLPQDILDIDATPSRNRRKMTGMTSKHFTPERRNPRKRKSAPSIMEVGDDFESGPDGVAGKAVASDTEAQSKALPTRSIIRKQSKGTGRKSTYFTPTKPALDPNVIDRVDFYNTTAGHRNKTVRRVPAGTSTAPVPPITSEWFGIIQEKLWREPFWLLIAVTFLNKTTGRAAAPVFWALKEQYRTPEGLAAASQEELEDKIWHLGLQRQRSKRLIKIAQAWIDAPPQQHVRRRTFHYPTKGDGKMYKPSEIVTEDADDCAGALEIGHIPGCGPYAWDSWRIFCRDALRGIAHDYNGSEADVEGFEPEWKRVLPLDKELRACLRWMWLREGWIWNCETGEKRMATDEEMERARQGEMEFADEKEREFAAKAAGAEILTPVREGDESLMPDSERMEVVALPAEKVTPERQSSAGDNVVVTPTRKGLRRSTRLSAG